MRQFGRLMSISDKPLSPTATDRVLRELLTPWQRGQLDEHGEVDFAHTVEGVGRFRANVYIHHRGVNGVFHFVPPTPPTLEALSLPTSLARLTNYAQGLILVTGPAGCGKTSTLAALVDIINAERSDHILTIEDPIEYLHPSKRCVVNQRQVGRHTTSFARALRGALREDPDIICIGELRDLETISLALSAAETGHLVLATLHTGSSIGTINRIVGAYPPNQQPQVRAMMSESLRAIISQRLVPRADGGGVIPALEVLYVNKAVGKCIRDNRTFQINSVLQTGKAQGMQRLDDALFDLVAQGIITDEAAREHSNEGAS
jgi:twitching motility protein PilT